VGYRRARRNLEWLVPPRRRRWTRPTRVARTWHNTDRTTAISAAFRARTASRQLLRPFSRSARRNLVECGSAGASTRRSRSHEGRRRSGTPVARRLPPHGDIRSIPRLTACSGKYRVFCLRSRHYVQVRGMMPAPPCGPEVAWRSTCGACAWCCQCCREPLPHLEVHRVGRRLRVRRVRDRARRIRVPASRHVRASCPRPQVVLGRPASTSSTTS
jgi:hypothetical protein